ncbi:hypothetical protein [Leucobacter chromiireducens]|uniref:hypothetical protein n=1 Tax=Leucobacter chromiireducens TaxID=283877 RepID=UPI003F7E9D59
MSKDVDLIELSNTTWDEQLPGIQLRTVPAPDGSVWNLVKYAPGAVRDDVWCTKGHRGFVFDGEMSYEYEDDGSSFSVPAGNGFIVNSGRAHRGHNFSNSEVSFMMIDDA